jgi:hypothetical protein
MLLHSDWAAWTARLHKLHLPLVHVTTKSVTMLL